MEDSPSRSNSTALDKPPVGCGRYPHNNCGCDCDRASAEASRARTSRRGLERALARRADSAPGATEGGGRPARAEKASVRERAARPRRASPAGPAHPPVASLAGPAHPPVASLAGPAAASALAAEEPHPAAAPPAKELAREKGPPDPDGPLVALWSALREWHAALATWIGAMRAYARELDAEGRKTLGGHWEAARVAAEDAAAEYVAALGGLGAPPLAPREGAAGRLWPIKWPRGATRADLESLGALPEPAVLAPTRSEYERLLGLGDALERVGHGFAMAAAGLTDPAVRTAAAAGMSRSYSEALQDYLASIAGSAERIRRLATKAVRRAAPAGAAFGAALGPDEIAEAFDRGGHGGLAAEVYLGALQCGAARAAAGLAGAAENGLTSGWALARLNGAKERAFGLAHDSSGAIAQDAKSLAQYHPAQAMSSNPGAIALWASTPAPAGVLDLTLPGTRLAVAYDLDRLVDRAAATEFGPVASNASGLNYRLVERLRTISASAIAAPAAGAERSGADERARWADEPVVPPSTPLVLTTNGGRTLQSVLRREPWAPLAGSRPRLGRLAMAEEAVILEAIRAERDAGWDLALRARFEAAAVAERLPSGACDQRADSLLAALVACLGAAYDAAPPETPAKFVDLAVGHSLDPAGCIAEAVSRHGWAIIAARLQAEVAALGAPRVPYAALAREAFTAEAADSLRAAQELWKRLRANLRVSVEAFDRDEPSRKLALLQDFRQAAARALRESPIECAPVTPAFFAASRAL